MSATVEMTINERRKYLCKMWERYRQASKKEKGKLLDEMEAVTGMHRKSLNRILTGRLSRKKRERERGREYGVEIDDAIRMIARSLDYPCAERLQPNLGWMAQHLEKHGEIRLTEGVVEKLQRISVSTVKRVLKRVGRSEEKLAYRKPKRSHSQRGKDAYPMRKIAWDIAEPGHFEVDLVHHCGESAVGEYIHTLQMVDVATGWCELAAIYGRSYRVVADGFDFILSRLPFPLVEIHPDNGSEFFSHHLLRFWGKRCAHLTISRSRPYHKNDNRFVEENNHSLVRAYVGHGRFDTQAHLNTLRCLFQKLWLYHNFFQPVLRLRQKVYHNPPLYRRKFDTAQAPYDRLVSTGQLSDTVRAQLDTLRSQTNPLQLRKEIDRLISELISLPTLDKTHTVNVFSSMLKKKEVDHSVTLSFEPTERFR